ncbi:MAG: T9SS type A sorting domain-containing protein [Flavobacteriales bacterium]|nr:T9SS type A sorting domain-containing protein [Flavobacteriales bacterium]
MADAPVTLGGTPSGGTWSGTGVSGNQFDPGAATPGANVLTYTYTDGNGCTDDCEVTVNVVADDSDGDGTPDCDDDCPLAVNGTPNLNTTTCNCELGYYATTTVIGLNTVITACTLCPPGSYCPDGIDQFACPAGYFSVSFGQVVCNACSAGTFSAVTGSIACQSCAAGYYNPTTAATSCLACDAGTFSDVTGSIACQSCAAGYYNPTTAATSCLACAAGTFSDVTGSIACQSCAAGYYNPTTAATSWLACDAGTFSAVTGSVACQSCAAGYYNPTTAATSCLACDAGTFSDVTGSIACQSCAAGYYNPTTAATSCLACDAGTFSAVTGSIACQSCAAGYYNPITAATECLACPAGSFSGTLGSIACQLCAAGTYNQVEAAVVCPPCDAGSSSYMGAIACFDDADGDLIEDGVDNCPSNDQLNESCICQGSCPGNNLELTITTDGAASQTSWEIIPQGGGAPVWSGSGYANLSTVIVDQCLPAGCYFLRVLDSGGNGMGTGGYVLGVQNGGRIIDNAGDGVFTSVSQIAGVNGFCLPIGTDQVVPWRCDVETWLPSDFIQVQPNPLVSAQYGTGNQTDDGYQWWFFNPDGGYTRRIFVSHATASYQFPIGAARCSYLRFSDLVTLPLPQDVLLNVRVRSRVNGTYAEFGPACRLKIDVVGQCPLTQLVNDINSPYHSCGITNVVLNGSKRLYAQYISGANKYQFEFDDINSSYLRTIASTSTSLLLQPWATLPLQYGKTYNVRVRASFDNGASYCPWGLVCTITTAAAPPVASRTMEEPMVQLGSTELLLWPNPNQGDKLNLSLTGIDDYEGPAYLEVLDLLGRPVLRHALVVAHSDLNAVVELDGTMGTGVYLVQLTVGERVFTQRLVIN